MTKDNFFKRRKKQENVMSAVESVNLGVQVDVCPHDVCHECGCWMDKDKAKEVTRSSWLVLSDNELNYCKKCKPPYDKVVIYISGNYYYKLIPEHYERVNEDGSPWVEPKVAKGKNKKPRRA